MPAPAARPFAKPHPQAVSPSNDMSGRDRKAGCDEESRPLRAGICVEPGRTCSQQASCHVFALHVGSSSSLRTGGAAASRRSQEAVTVTCALPPTSASTLSMAPALATISIPNSTVRESGLCSSRAWRTDVTTPRTVWANSGSRRASPADAIRCPSPTSTGPEAPSLVAACSACTRTHIRSPLGSIT